MEKEYNDVEFDRTRIYEYLKYKPEPIGYSKKVSWIVQQQIAATNGKQYTDRVGKLDDYPIYNMPIPVVDQGIMLDIGSGWGRWLVAGANKGYIPIGLDLRVEFCKASLRTLKDLGKNGYIVVADLKNLPFKRNIFDLVWSFGVIQHTHKQRMSSCLTHINRILKNKGFTYLEFPNRLGIRNRFFAPINYKEQDNYNSWAVRYYSISEYRKIFEEIFGNFQYKNHSFIGIGVLPEDIKYVSFKNKILCLVSLLGSFLADYIPFLKNVSDSVYYRAAKKIDKLTMDDNVDSINSFLQAHKRNPNNNLNLCFLLSCPISGGELELSPDNKFLISKNAGVAYPIEDDIPILIESEAKKI